MVVFFYWSEVEVGVVVMIVFFNDYFFHCICCHPSLPSTTDVPHCGHPPWWVVAVVDAGGGWHQWWFVAVGGSSGCQRLAVVSGVGWQ